jgi:hypothetical protein
MRSQVFALPIAFALMAAPAQALYQEYQLAGSIAAAPSYSFATGQYRLYDNQVLLRRDFLAFEYDVDSLYADYAYGISQYVRAGASGKAHVFDYQNLNHIVDSSTGAEINSVALNSPYYRGNVFAEARYRELSLRYLVGAQRYHLSRRESADRALRVESPSTALVNQVALGYWRIQAPRPYAINGIAAFVTTEVQQMQSGYVWELNGVPLSSARKEVIIHELHIRAGDEFAGGALRLMAALRAGATNFSLPGESQDLIQSFSVGGPEARYRRLAGYAFSEFRAPTFALLNLDAMVHAGGPVNLWFVADAVMFDREPRGLRVSSGQEALSAADREFNGQRFHAGAGVGLIFDLPQGMLGSRSALFARAEVPFFAAGGSRFQIFLGMNGQVF